MTVENLLESAVADSLTGVPLTTTRRTDSNSFSYPERLYKDVVEGRSAAGLP